MNRPGKKTIIVFIILSITGIVLSYILAQEYYFGSIFNKSGEKLSMFADFSRSVCGGDSSFVNCEKVGRSNYSRFFNIPVAAWGMFYFALMAFLSVFFLLIKEKLNSFYDILFFWFIAFGAIYDIILLFISIFVINAVCSLCLMTYLAIWIVFVVMIVYFAKRKRSPFKIDKALKEITRIKASLPKYIIIILGALILSGGAGFGTNYYLLNQKNKYSMQKKEVKIKEILKEFAKIERLDIKYSDISIIGDPNAPVTIIEFSDFMCPHCSKSSEKLEKYIKDNPQKAKLVFMNYPLDTYCNDFIKKRVHPGACELAKGAICASKQNDFKGYHDFVFNMKFKRARMRDMITIAKYTGLDASEFEACMFASETEEELLSQIKTAREAGVKSTPSIYINGKRYKFKIVEQLIDRIVDNEIKGSK